MFKISPLTNCFRLDKDYIVIGMGSSQKIISEIKYSQYQCILKYLTKEKSNEELYAYIDENGYDRNIINELIDAKLITQSECIFAKEDTNEYKNKLYIETLYNGIDRIINKFNNTSFVIVGCGGIGNYLGYSLISMNPKTVILLDGDKVEESNLNRQFCFGYDDIGKYKASILAREFRKRNKHIDILTYNRYADKDLLINIVNKEKQKEYVREVLVIISGDANNVISTVTRVAVECNVPFINVGYLNDYSCIGPFFIPKMSSCPFCQNIGADYPEDDIESDIYFRDYYDAPSAAVNNSIASAMAFIDILHYISGNFNRINSLNKRVGISNGDFNKLEITIEKNDKCEYCGKQEWEK